MNTFNVQGILVGHTARVATTDTSQLLSDAVDASLGFHVDWLAVKAVTITVETFDARLSFGTAATNGGSPVGHVLAAGGSIRLPSNSLVRGAQIISKTAGSAAVLQVTLEG